MKFFTSFFALFLLCSPVLMAQFHYSYISDKRFQSPDELLGYEMKPNVIVYPNKDNPKRSREETLNPGDITFRATRNYLIIESEQFEQYKGAYSVNSINPEQYGFKLDLMNARNPSIQGHLKIILNGKSQIDAYIFKPSPTEQEVIFYQSKIPENLATIERAYFTDIGDVTITDTTLWGTTVYPFFELEKKQLTKVIGINAVDIEHIGSTAVAGLAAKPIIDILIEVTSLKALDMTNKSMETLGYRIKGENGIAGRRYY